LRADGKYDEIFDTMKYFDSRVFSSEPKDPPFLKAVKERFKKAKEKEDDPSFLKLSSIL
jgi:hypothetical protein